MKAISKKIGMTWMACHRWNSASFSFDVLFQLLFSASAFCSDVFLFTPENFHLSIFLAHQ